METGKETYEFKTEIKQLMNIIINSLYSNKEIFLRELISNASDAIDRLRFKSQTEPEILGDDTEFKIKLSADENKRTLEISDNGIGMTAEEVKNNIGTIAKSGTKAFLEAIKQSKQQDIITPELIGQFGIGFYSAFIVAEKITLITRSAGTDKAVRWESTGDGSYSIEETKKDSRGTTIILKLKDVEKSEQDFSREWIIRDTVKKHSDFVNYPIVMDIEKKEPVVDKDGKPLLDEEGNPKEFKNVVREETINSMKAIWTRDKKDISEEEYNEFYTHLSHDWNPPLTRIHLKLEGTTEYTFLLYIPSKAPFDMFSRQQSHGVNLYSRRVFIMNDCKELIPDYLRFVKGVIDAPDLNLNVSREILQQDRIVKNIRKNIVKKILGLLEEMEKDKFESFYNEFGQVIKEGVHTDFENRGKLTDLLRYKTTRSNGKMVSLKEYVSNMNPDQNEIYYITGENLSALLNSPHLEKLKEKDLEVLLMTDPIDEWVVMSVNEYEGKKFKSAEKGDLEIDKVDDKKKNEYDTLFEFIRSSLETKVKKVKPSSHLKDSVSCLSGEASDMSTYMEKIMKASGQKPPETKRVLELNMDHPVLEKIKTLFEKDKESQVLKDYTDLLFDIALIGEGSKVENPSRLSKIVGNLMSEALDV